MLWFSQFRGNHQKNKSVFSGTVTTAVRLLSMVLSYVMYEELPIIFAVINMFVHFTMNTDQKREKASPVMKLILKWAVPAASVIRIPFSLSIFVGRDIPIQIFLPAPVGVLPILCGNYLPESRQNYTIEIKLPWTLSSQDNWNKTHRLAGIIFMTGGFYVILYKVIK